MHADLNLLEGNTDLPVVKAPTEAEVWKAAKAQHNLEADQGVTTARALAAALLPIQVEKLATLLNQEDDPDVLRKSLETLHRIAQDPDKAAAQQTFGVSLSLTIAPSTLPADAMRTIDVRRGKARSPVDVSDAVPVEPPTAPAPADPPPPTILVDIPAMEPVRIVSPDDVLDDD